MYTSRIQGNLIVDAGTDTSVFGEGDATITRNVSYGQTLFGENGSDVGSIAHLVHEAVGVLNHMEIRYTYMYGAGGDPFNIGIDNDSPKMLWNMQSSMYRQAMVLSDSGGGSTTMFGISRSSDSGASWDPQMVMTQDGRIGFHTNAPTGPFDVMSDALIDGKLTVTGLIDPTGLVLDEQSSVPAPTTAAKGTVWVKDTTPNQLLFTNDAGEDITLGTKLDRTIILSPTGGDANTIPDAITQALALTPTSGDRVVILGTPGTYMVSSTVVWPSYVDFFTDSSYITVLPTANNFDVISLTGPCRLARIRVMGATLAAGFTASLPGPEIAILDGCDSYGCLIGFRSTGATTTVNIIRCTGVGCTQAGFFATSGGTFAGLLSFGIQCGIGYECDGGSYQINQAQADTCTTGFSFLNSPFNLVTVSQAIGCGTGFFFGTACYVDSSNIQAISCTVDLQTTNDLLGCTVIGARFDEAKLTIADDTLVSLNIRDANARDKFFGTAAVFDIQQIDLFGTSDAGGRQPALTQVADDGGGVPTDTSFTTTSALSQDASIPYNGTLVFNGDYTVEFWINPQPTPGNNNQFLVSKLGSIDIRYQRNNRRIRFSQSGAGTVTTVNNLVISNVRTHVACVHDNVNKNLIIYINGDLASGITYGGVANDTGNVAYLCRRWFGTGGNYTGSIDEINFWSKAMDEIEVETRYNSGLGSINVDLVDLMAGYHCNEGAGITLTDYSGNGNNATHDGTYGTGLILSTLGTDGVITYLFEPDRVNELFFNAHPNATYEEGKAIIPILHWAPNDTVIGDVYWCFELSSAEPNAAYGNTTVSSVVSASTGTEKEHLIVEFPSFTLNDFRAIILGRVFRAGDDVLDTYTGGALLIGFELKFTKNKLGSDT